MKVLLIEDEKKAVQSLKKGLNEHHIEVDFAMDGTINFYSRTEINVIKIKYTSTYLLDP